LGGGENNGIFPSGKFEKIMGNCNLFIKQIWREKKVKM
jgi:hypothetical protein